MKLPISAIIVGFNEAHLLKSSLPKLQFCDEIIYFDLSSNDNSIEVAEKFNARIICHEKVDGCEWIHSDWADKTKHNWILITDPDEVIPQCIIDEIFLLFKNGLKDNIGAIYTPIFYYFKNKRLLGTIWGGQKHRLLLAHNKRFTFLPLVHSGRHLKDDYISHTIKTDEACGIQHYWSNSFRSLITKHLRYLKNEAVSRYNSGNQTTAIEVILKPLKTFRSSYFLLKGYKDGISGLLLSAFYAWYETAASFKLLTYQRRNRNK